MTTTYNFGLNDQGTPELSSIVAQDGLINEIDRNSGVAVIENAQVSYEGSTEPETEMKEARTFKIGFTGLEAMLTEDGIKEISTEAGEVAVVSGSDIETKEIPGFEQDIGKNDYSHTPSGPGFEIS